MRFYLKSGYEVAFNVTKGQMARVRGGFPIGRWPDIEIFWHDLWSWFDLNECDGADDRYIGEVYLKVK